jgi:pimeloyl-ACP methyl ester carboxylesterase
MRATFRALGLMAPPLAALWAERLFLTPPRHTPPAREAEALAAAHPGSVQVDGHTLATWTWGHGPTVLLVHGWGGRGGQLHAFVPALLAAGYSVVAFDGPGHGRSTGKTSSLVEHGRAVRGVVAALPSEVVGLIAHSMGGASAAFAMSEGMHVDRAVFVGSPSSASEVTRTFSAGLALRPAAAQRMRARIERRLRVPFDDLEVSRLGRGSATSLLVIHDEGDKEVPWSDGLAISESWPNARLHTTQGLGHRRILSDADVVDAAVMFVDARG